MAGPIHKRRPNAPAVRSGLTRRDDRDRGVERACQILLTQLPGLRVRKEALELVPVEMQIAFQVHVGIG